MSFYATLCLPDRVEVITDGAAWDPDGIVRRFSRKIDAVPNVPAAITTRGHVATADAVTAAVLRLFRKTGSYDATLGILAGIIPQIADRLGAGFDRHIEMVIAGFSETEGPITYFWGSKSPAEGLEALVLHGSKTGVMCGHEHSSAHHAKFIEAGGFRAKGAAVELVNFFRRTADPSVEMFAGGQRVPIGGHIDMTTVRADGVKTERVHTYAEDKVGEQIDPFANDPTVTPLMNRKQRRALARQRRHAAA